MEADEYSNLISQEFGSPIAAKAPVVVDVAATKSRVAKKPKRRKKVSEALSQAVETAKDAVKEEGQRATREGIIGSLAGFGERHPYISGGLGTLGSIAAWTLGPMLLDKLLHGREQEEQMPAGGAFGGGMDGLAGAGSDGSDRDMYDLMSERDMIQRMRDLGRSSNNVSYSLMHPSGNNAELAKLISGDEARLAQIQSERRLTPAEIMSAING